MNVRAKEPHEFTPEEARRLIQAIFDYRPENRWEIFKDWLAKVVRRKNRR